jgi:hypothetical protein
MKKIIFAILFSTFLCEVNANPFASTDIVINQVYGGGGNSGAPYQCDFIELYNTSAAPVSLNGLSVQYATNIDFPTPANTFILPNVSLGAGKYYLIQLFCGSAGATLPTPDFSPSTVSINAISGRVFLVNGTTPVTACNAATIKDLLGYGAAAACSETAPTANLSNTTSATRNTTTDTDNNSIDFSVTAPIPHNSLFVLSNNSLRQLSVIKQGKKALLHFALSCTSSDMKYSVQRSLNGITFQNIFEETVTQARCEQPFDYIDNNPINGINYYRIEAKNQIGRNSFSNFAVVNFAIGTEIKVVPTLASDFISVFYTATEDSEIDWQIVNAAGKTMLIENKVVKKGYNSFTFDISKFTSGAYFIKGNTILEKIESIQFIKQ